MAHQELHDWAAEAAQQIAAGKTNDVVKELGHMPKMQAVLAVHYILSYHTKFLDDHEVYSKFQRALERQV